MGIPFFIVFTLSIVFLSIGITGWGNIVSIEWSEQDVPEQDVIDAESELVSVTPYLSIKAYNSGAIVQCVSGFLLFLLSLYVMGFLLYLEERESGRIMKNVKSYVRLRQFLERRRNRDVSQ